MTWATTGFLIHADAPSTVFYQIIDKIPWMFDVVYNALSEPIVRWMILLSVILLFVFKL